MKKRWIAVTFLAFLLAVSAWQLHRRNERLETRERNTQQGREAAHALISGGYLYIEMGREKAWRPTFERLLAERYGLKFPRRSFCLHIIESEDRAMEDAMEKVMKDEVARRFEPGTLEQLAQEAEKIYIAEQAATPNP